MKYKNVEKSAKRKKYIQREMKCKDSRKAWETVQVFPED